MYLTIVVAVEATDTHKKHPNTTSLEEIWERDQPTFVLAPFYTDTYINSKCKPYLYVAVAYT